MAGWAGLVLVMRGYEEVATTGWMMQRKMERKYFEEQARRCTKSTWSKFEVEFKVHATMIGRWPLPRCSRSCSNGLRNNDSYSSTAGRIRDRLVYSRIATENRGDTGLALLALTGSEPAD